MEIVQGFTEAQRGDVARLFWDAFSGKLNRVLGPPELGRAFIASVLNPDFALCAVEDEHVVGVAGFKTSEGGLVGGDLSDLTPLYGWFGGLWRGVLLDQLERNLSEKQLLMDGIFVDAAARGQGVGTRLLDAVLTHAKCLSCTEVRLDVIDSNTRARALYERVGFTPSGSVKTGPLRHVFGFREATTMVRALT